MIVDKKLLEIVKPENQLKLFGYDEYLNFFIKLLKKNKIPNSVLFSGEKGLGKSTFVYHLINYFLSKNEKNNYSIENFSINDENSSYLNMTNNIHPNFFFIGLKDLDTEIKIEQIKKLKNFIEKSTYSVDLKIIMIDSVEYLNLNSSNALLKAIEEPGENTLFFLIHNNSYKILETVKSRCIEFKLFFTHNKKKQIFNHLISDYDLDFNGDLISDFLYFTSPGNLLKFLIFLQNNKIPLSKDILSIIFNLIDYLKIQKNSEGLYYLSLLVEKFYNEQLLLNAKNSYIYFFNYHKILNQLNDMKKFNLDVKNILLSIQHTLKNEK